MIDTSQKEIKLIAVYGRVSTSHQENEGTIETQLSAVNEYAKKNHYTIVQEYLDNGWSGDSLARPALDQLRMDAKKKNWEAVLIYDPDRLARRGAWQEVVMEELKELEIDVLFVTIPKAKTDEDVIMYKMRGVFAEYERMKIKERFRLGKLRKVSEGHVLTTEAPYGYCYVPNKKIPNQPMEHGYYEINPTEARVVKMIFEWVGNDGLTLRKVVRRLQELGIKPKRSKRGVWNTSTLTTTLRNKAYIGEAHYGSSYAVVPENPISKERYRQVKKSSRKMKPEAEWIASKIPVPVIIEKELFERVREQLKANFALCERNTKNEYLLGSKIFCSCGRKRCGEGPQHGKHLYYRCSDRVYSFPLPRTCMEGGINARIADKLVWNKIVGLMSSPDLLHAQLDRWINTRKNKVVSSIGDTKAIGKEIVKLMDQEGRYNKAYGAGLFTIKQLGEYTAPIKEQIVSLESQVTKAKQQENQISTSTMPDRGEIESFAKESVKVLSDLSFTLKRAIIINTVEKVIGTQQQLQVFGHIPLSLNYVEYKTESRNCWVTERWEIDVIQGTYAESGGYQQLSILYY